MGFLEWFGHNWFVVLQSAGIIGGLLFTAVSLRTNTKARQVGNLLAVTAEHRAIWAELYGRPALRRITSPAATVDREPLREEEETFVLELILHLSVVFKAMNAGMVLKPDGLRKDIQAFFSLPIPQVVWRKWRDMQDPDFVAFVEGCLTEG